MTRRPGLVALLALLGCASSSGTSASPVHKDAGSDAGKIILPPRDASGSHLVDASGSHLVDARSDGATTARANGTVSPWQTVNAMPRPRANHCSVVIGEWLVAIGGNAAVDGGFASTDAVDVAPIQADGTLGQWALAGSTPSPVYECTATTHGTSLLLVDGIFDDMSKGGQVWSATLSATGTLGSWTSLGALPAGVDFFYSDAWVVGDTLYATTSGVGASGAATGTLTASLASGLGPWTENDWFAAFRGHPEYAHTPAFVFVLGGYASDPDSGANPVVTDVHGAPIEANGTIGQGYSTTPLPAPTAFGTVVAVDDYVFLAGGKPDIFAASGQSAVASAEVLPSGPLGTWANQPALPEGRTDHAMVLGGDYLFLTGGGFAGPGLDTVFSAKVRF